MSPVMDRVKKLESLSSLQDVKDAKREEARIAAMPPKKTKEEIEAEKAEYEERQKILGLYRDHPVPYVGQQVRWYPNGIKNEAWLGAVVTHVGIQAVSLCVFQDRIQIAYRDGVLHIRHPDVMSRKEQKQKFRDEPFAGCWDFSQETYDLEQCQIDVRHLVKKLMKLESALGGTDSTDATETEVTQTEVKAG